MVEAFFSPVGSAGLTLAVFVAAQAVYAKTRFFLLHPVLTSIAVLIALLWGLDVSYETYSRGGSYITIFLGPAVVALGVPLYRELARIKKEAGPILATSLFGCAAGLLSALVPALLWGLPREVTVSLAPKSATTPIAMAVAEGLGGLPSLSAAVVVVTGIAGAVIGPLLLKFFGVTGAPAFGLALGIASHGIGTARALEEGLEQGAFSSLGLCLNGILTAVLTPLAVALLFPS